MNGNKKEKREVIAAIKDSGKIAISNKEFLVVESIATKLKDSVNTSFLLSNGYAELSFFWIDEDTGVLCKCRPDYYIPENYIVELKTAASVMSHKFKYACRDLGYHISAVFYQEGVRQIMNDTLEMIFITVENSRPYDFKSFYLSKNSIDAGCDDFKKALEIYADCVKHNEWPGFSKTIVELDVTNFSTTIDIDFENYDEDCEY